MLELFVACAPGLEPLLASELAVLGVEAAREIPGGVEFAGDASSVGRVALGSSLGIRLLVRITRFPTRHFSSLERACRRVEWAAWIPPGSAVEVRAHAKHSKLRHTGAIAQRVSRSIEDALGPAATPDTSDPFRVQARLEDDFCTLSLDLAGGALQRRGYRLEVGKAPLREDLASALLRVAGFEPGVALLDPMCGAGTIPIEAARLALGISPGSGRRFAFERLVGWDAADVSAPPDAGGQAGSEAVAPIHGSDRDAGAIRAARDNAARAGVAEIVHFENTPLSRAPRPDGGRILIVSNPPYGRRIRGPGGLRDLYAALGNLRRKLGDRARLALVTPDPALARATGVSLESAFLTDLGGIKIRAYVEAER